MKTWMSHVSLLLLAAAAGAGGGAIVRALEPARAVPRSEPPPPAVVEAGVPAGRLAELARDMDARLRALEARPMAAPPAPQAPPAAAEEPVVPEGPFTHAASEALFERLARRRERIGGTIERLESAIREDPEDADLFCALATAYAAKTAFDTPPGPEQGVVWEKAVAAYEKAIALDPGHWEARYGKAFGDSMAPEFVGLRPKAIRQFEELMEIQETRAPAGEHVLVYVRLGTLYKDAGNVDRARAVWTRGRERFPEDERLAELLELLGEEPR